MSYLPFVYLFSVPKLIPNFIEFFILSLALLHLLKRWGSYYIANIRSIVILSKLQIKLPNRDMFFQFSKTILATIPRFFRLRASVTTFALLR